MHIVASHPALTNLRVETNGVITTLEKLKSSLPCLAAMSPADRPLLDIAAKFVPLAIATEWANLYYCALDGLVPAPPPPAIEASRRAAWLAFEAADALVHPYIDTIRNMRAYGAAGLIVKAAAMLFCHGDDLREMLTADREERSDRSLQASFSIDIVDMLADLPAPTTKAAAALPATDCELVTIAAQFEAALEHGRRELVAQSEREAAIEASIPVPETLRFREADRPMLARLRLDAPKAGVYSDREIHPLRQISPLAPGAERLRAREIVDAYALRDVAIGQARAEIGFGTPDEELNKILAPSAAARGAIAETPACTLEGLAAKAVAACNDFDGGFSLNAPNEIVCRSLLADLLRLAGRLPADEGAMEAVSAEDVDVAAEAPAAGRAAAAEPQPSDIAA